MKRSTVFYKIYSLLFLAFVGVMVLHAQNVITHNIGTQGSLTISGNSTDNYIITGTTTVNTVTIQSGYKGTITLRNLNITSSRSGSNGVSGVSCITVEGEYNRSNLDPITQVDVILEGTNSLTYTASTSGCAFQVNQGAQIHINAIDRNDNNSGVLTARNTADGSAAIGAPYFSSGHATGQGTAQQMSCDSGSFNRTKTAGGNVLIGSGNVTALGYQHGAGIGGGWYTYYNGTIIVYGGVVVAQSNYHAAGIGSGCPQGSGVLQCYPENSVIVALPPAEISAKGTSGGSTTPTPLYGLNGAKTIIYMNDLGKSTITVHTEDYEKDADIYVDLSGMMANNTIKLEDLFQNLGVQYDLKKVRVGRTDATTGIYQFNAEFKDKTTFFTDASSSNINYTGRPYMPKEVDKIIGSPSNKVDVELELLKMQISFVDYPSTPLIENYTAAQALQNAHVIKMEYNDDQDVSDLTFQLQGGGVDFQTLVFLASDRTTVVSAPTKLKKGDIYYIVLPIKVGKPLGIYSDVLLIGCNWGSTSLPGYIRRIGLQRVVKDDTGQNEYIKVTSSLDKFLEVYPTTKSVDLTLNIDHKNTNVLYDPLDVKAKYLITTEADYDAALAATPLNSWKNLSIPATNGQNQMTNVSFANLAKGIYYIHWYVESGVVYAHSQAVTSPPLKYGGFGPYMIVDPVNSGKLSGNPSVCAGQVPSEIKGEASTGGSGDFSYQWQISSNGTSWTNIGGDTQNYTPAMLTVSPTYYRRITTDKQYGGTTTSNNVFTISVVTDGQTLYWKRNATNNNWNDPSNWVDASGIALNIVPVSCSNVYIPGGADNYPSLHTDITPVDVYGSPTCNNITFGYGSELAYQHKLAYEKAYVQYNWGYYKSFSGVNYGDQPKANEYSPASANKRDVWYALSAPLKSMATGDFSFAGYPFTWQAGFALADPVTGLKGGDIEVGDFTNKLSVNDVAISETNNAIAVKVALYQNAIGYADHSNLEGLKGIIEIPYFENATKSIYYPGHIYDRFTQISKFFYFNPKTLQLLHSPVGNMKRGNESYRFIYETSGTAPNINVNGSSPSSVPGYEQKVKRQSSKSLKVMIGNPFMASINAKKFFDANNNKLLESDGYLLFDSQNQTWAHYAFAKAGNIPPLQAFIITLKAEEVNLLFPLEGTYALTEGASTKNTSLDNDRSGLYMKSIDNTGLGGDNSVLISATTGENMTNVKKMINSDGHATPEAFFIASDNKNYNLIQIYEKGIHEVQIGVKSSDTKNPLSLTFGNVNDFIATNNLYPVLFDKHLGIKQNLDSKNSYDFTQRRVEASNKYIDADRFVLQFLNSDQVLDIETDFSIVYNNKQRQIEVKSSQGVKQIHVYDILGRQIYSESDINSSYYVKPLLLQQGVYVIKVYTDNGETKVDKIMAL